MEKILNGSVLNGLNIILFVINRKGLVRKLNYFSYSQLQVRVNDNIFEKIKPLLDYKDNIVALEENEKFEIEKIKINGKVYKVFFFCKKGDEIFVHLKDISELEEYKKIVLHTQRLEILGTLSGGFAHDFNNMLTGILGTFSLLKHRLKCEEIDHDEILQHIDKVEIIAMRAAEVADRILYLSKKRKIEKEILDLRDLVGDVLIMLKNSFDKRIKIEIDMPSYPLFIKCERINIIQILLNLCINAEHAMTIMRKNGEKMGGKLSIKLRETKFDDKDIACISISDTGVGIKKEILNKIFEPFFTTKKDKIGSGLGLSIVKKLTEENNGKITVNSIYGKGTTFNVYFPLENINMLESKVKYSVEKDLVMGTGNILIIEDEEMIANLLNSALSKCGYNVKVTLLPEEGLKWYKEHKNEIDLVILDLLMPGMDGKEVFMRLKKIDDKVKVILISGFVKDDRIEEILKMGALDFIHKPFNVKDLSIKVRKYIK